MSGQRTPAAIAATLFNRLETIEQERSEALATAPDSINQRYDERRRKLLEKIEDDEVRTLLYRMLGEGEPGVDAEQARKGGK